MEPPGLSCKITLSHGSHCAERETEKRGWFTKRWGIWQVAAREWISRRLQGVIVEFCAVLWTPKLYRSLHDWLTDRPTLIFLLNCCSSSLQLKREEIIYFLPFFLSVGFYLSHTRSFGRIFVLYGISLFSAFLSSWSFRTFPNALLAAGKGTAANAARSKMVAGRCRVLEFSLCRLAFAVSTPLQRLLQQTCIHVACGAVAAFVWDLGARLVASSWRYRRPFHFSSGEWPHSNPCFFFCGFRVCGPWPYYLLSHHQDLA